MSIRTNNHNKILESFIVTNECLNDPILLIDNDGVILHASSNLVSWVKTTSTKLVNKNLFTDPLPNFLAIYQKFSLQIKSLHQEIINSKSKKTFLETSKFDSNALALFVTKTPIFDESNNFLFLHIRFKNFTIARVANLAYKFYGLKGFPTKAQDFENFNLTRIQSMVLYMYARNYSYTEVSNLLTRFGYKISPSAVNKQLDKLKKIFGVNNNELLRDMSLKLGYDVAIPAEFMPEGSHDITGDIFELWVC